MIIQLHFVTSTQLQNDEIISQVNEKQFHTSNQEYLSFGNDEALK